MKHKGVEFLILARPGRNQWTYVISYPENADPSRTQFQGREMKRLPLLVPGLVLKRAAPTQR
jgi:hypothetical protein